MYIDGNGMQIPCAAVHRDGGWTFAGAGVEDVNGAFVLRTDDGILLREFNTSDWLRVVRGTGSLMLTDAPEPPPVPDLDTLRAAKLAELSDACNAAIVAGCDVTLTDGTAQHFALEETDQINLNAAYTACQQGAAKYPYHADGQLCRLYSAADIIAIGDAATAHKLYHTTYCNHLLTWARRAEAADELSDIVYGAELPGDLAANMVKVLGGAT